MASGPSDKAKRVGDSAVRELQAEDRFASPVELTDAVLAAAHDPALGLDRSVCLTDVVEALRAEAGRWTTPDSWQGRDSGLEHAARFLEREFTEARPGLIPDPHDNAIYAAADHATWERVAPEELAVGDEVEADVIVSSDGYEWTRCTVIATEPLSVRWWDGDVKTWRPDARYPRFRRRASALTEANRG